MPHPVYDASEHASLALAPQVIALTLFSIWLIGEAASALARVLS